MRAKTVLAGLLCALALSLQTAAQSGTERVIGGVQSKNASWPFMAYLLIGGNWQCGGSLVSRQFILTAAHCTYNDETKKVWDAGAFSVRLGSNDSQAGGTLHRVRRVIMHENYNPATNQNDIALLELDAPVDVPTIAIEGVSSRSSSVRFSAASRSSPFGKIVGWGRVDPKVQNSISRYLMEAPIPIVDSATCNAVMGKTMRGAIDARRICAGQSQGGVDSCNGDSGGPLLEPGDSANWVEVGVVSWGVSSCGDPKTYGVYTRVGAFSDWLTRNIGVVAGGAPPAPPPPPVSTPATALGPFANAATILAAADKENSGVEIEMLPGAGMKLGDVFTIRIRSALDGYLLLLDVDDSGKITQLFPNPRSALSNSDGRIRSGSPLTMPDASYGFQLRASEPLGRGRLIAVVAARREMLSNLARAQDGLADLPDRGSKQLERLEAVLKPEAAPSGPPSWIAGQRDYIVER
jgi:hypothetical protein